MVNKTVKVKNMLGLWFQVLFYSLLFTSLFFAFLPESRSIKNLVVAVMPILGKQWWYVSSYFALCFFIPFLNKAINNISQQTYKKILLLILFVICCIDCVLPIDAFTLNNGYSAIWLMIVYLREILTEITTIPFRPVFPLVVLTRTFLLKLVGELSQLPVILVIVFKILAT